VTTFDGLQAACTALLNSTGAIYAAYEMSLPARQLISVAQPAGDGEELAVYVARCYPGLPGREATQPQPCGGPVSAEIAVELWRCHPANNGTAIPSADALTAAAAMLHEDMLLLINSADLAAETLDLNGEALTGAATILGPRGAMAGVRALLVIPLARS
jgi:hypothetical protein